MSKGKPVKPVKPVKGKGADRKREPLDADSAPRKRKPTKRERALLAAVDKHGVTRTLHTDFRGPYLFMRIRWVDHKGRPFNNRTVDSCLRRRWVIEVAAPLPTPYSEAPSAAISPLMGVVRNLERPVRLERPDEH